MGLVPAELTIGDTVLVEVVHEGGREELGTALVVE